MSCFILVKLFYVLPESCTRVRQTIPWSLPIHKEGNEPCFILRLNMAVTFLSCKFYEWKYTVRTKGIRITLYFILSSISLVKYHCFYVYMVRINSLVNVKQKQTSRQFYHIFFQAMRILCLFISLLIDNLRGHREILEAWLKCNLLTIANRISSIPIFICSIP